MQIVPVIDQYWDDVVGELVSTGEVVGYKIVSETGALLGAGETRVEALKAAQDALLLPQEARELASS